MSDFIGQQQSTDLFNKLLAERDRLTKEVEEDNNQFAIAKAEITRLKKEVEKLGQLYQTSLKTNEAQAQHSASQSKEIEIIKNANDFLSKCVDSKRQEAELLKAELDQYEHESWKSRAEALAEAMKETGMLAPMNLNYEQYVNAVLRIRRQALAAYTASGEVETK